MATRKGTSGSDTISGAVTETVIYGYNGNDTISTLITTGTGPTVYGGGGNDSITGNTASDRLNGGDGADTISSGAGNDRVDGGSGNDVITMGAGTDIAQGNIGNDTITGGSGAQTIYGASGNDSISAGTEATATFKHLLYGGVGADTISSSASIGLNYMYGGSDNDSITGSTTGKDTINGGVGNNAITGGGSGGANHANETVTYFGMVKGAANGTLGGYDGVTVNLATSTAQVVSSANAVTDTIQFIDSVTGYNYNDTLTGNLFANRVNGGQGHDALDGGGTSTSGAAGAVNAGNDTMLGGYGNDTIAMHNGSGTDISIDGGSGSYDVLSFANVFNSATIALGATPGTIPNAPTGTYTSAVADGVYLNLSSDFGVVGGTLSDNLVGNAGTGKVVGIEKVIGTSFNDYIVSVGGATIDGGAGNDTISAAQGGNGTDVLRGGASGFNFGAIWSTSNAGNIYDGTSSSFRDYFGVGNANTEMNTIYGFNNGSAAQGDKLYLDISDWTATTHNIQTLAVGVTTGLYTDTLVGTKHVFTMNTATATNGGYSSTGAVQANANAQIYVTAGGDVIYDSNGNGAAGTTTIAHLDSNTFTAHTSLTGLTLDATDFVLVA
jgi:Ca2+-binding RTX toxin-like protein